MRKLELDIKANDGKWLRKEYQINKRGLRDIAIECNTTEDSIKTRLKRFNIPLRSHKEALKIRNKKYPVVLSQEAKDLANKKKRRGFYLHCNNCFKEVYTTRETRKFCSIACRNSYRREHIHREQDWRDWPEYNEWRSLVYFRDNYSCKICGSKTNINAHHIQEANKFPESRFEVSNGIVLCQKHHIQVHSPTNKELLLNNPNFGGSPEVDNPEASIKEYLFSLIRSND